MNTPLLLLLVFFSALAVLTAFLDLLTLFAKKRLPHQKGIGKRWKEAGVYRETVEKRKQKKRDKRFNQTDVIVFILGASVLFSVGLMFFRSIFLAVLFIFPALYFPKYRRGRMERKKTQLFLQQFRSAMGSIATSIRAGTSLQIALKRCEDDLKKELIAHKSKPVLDEINEINHDIQFGMSVDEALRQFKEKMKLEDVTQFVDSLLAVRSKGGNINHVIHNTSERISDKIMVQQEIQVATAQKRMEANMLSIFPVVFVLLIMVVSPDYLRPMYESTVGTFMLFIGALLLLANFFIGKKVTNIDL
ncbi:type II secretion system F family protein [Salibacterium halotolerans]|uniref:Tight adherence protein B n=1 Tax=Salibacterium halotolerans TaxID=1884432 RepID=A0A1I5TR21_9BACI|nr:type II secretion system F family protein [Salibacterium halotolerans]SFP85485.1 tight adherence protein B [Salibacterium halotolerans]